MKKIQYTSIEQQIEKLKSQNLVILNEEYTKVNLRSFGYTNLIKGYRDPYIINSNDRITYRSGVTFEQIRSLYILDKNLRNAVMASMQNLEEYIKETAANVVAKSFGTHQDDYLKYRFSLPGVLDTMKKSLDTDKEPIHHYMQNYGIVPPWILFKSIYFSTITNFIDLFKFQEQQQMTIQLYSNLKPHLPPESLSKLMMDTLYICMDYRNTAAHGGRIYNYNSSKRLRITEIFGENKISEIHGFSKLLFLLNYENPFHRLETTLNNKLTRHCNHFPQDVTYLGQIMNMNIIPKKIVYISEKSNKYHLNPHCSKLKNIKELLFEEANDKGYIPCKKCSI